MVVQSDMVHQYSIPGFCSPSDLEGLRAGPYRCPPQPTESCQPFIYLHKSGDSYNLEKSRGLAKSITSCNCDAGAIISWIRFYTL